MEILAKEKKNNIIFINLQETKNEELLDYHKLHDFALEHYKKEKNNYLIIDEVQLCTYFEKAINSLHTKELFDIYLTGSNAFLLSSDLATLFTGRTYQIEVYPFSFKEYVTIIPLINKAKLKPGWSPRLKRLCGQLCY